MREEFSQARMNRCSRIHQLILENWQRTKVLDYVVRARESIAELSLPELRLQYFSVGVGNDLTDLPFTDLLVVFSMIAQTAALMRAKVARNERQGAFQFSITTEFSDPDALTLLSQMKIETPFDTSSLLKIESAG
jgi:putative heme degradation protein